MPFTPVNPESLHKDQTRCSVSVELVGPEAIAFKQMSEENKISGKALLQQMISYCLAESKEVKKG